MAEQQSSIRSYNVILQGFKGVILYPSLVTPALVGPEGCMSLILAMEAPGPNNKDKDISEFFYETIILNESLGAGNKIGEIAARVLHSQLMFVPWGDGALASTDPKIYNNQKENLTAWTCMIYGGHNAAIDRYKNNLYQGWYLGKLPDGDQDYLIQGYDHNGQPRPWGVLHRGAVKLYREMSYPHLFQLNFKQFSCSYPSELYELVYMYFKVYDDDTDKERLEKAKKASKVLYGADSAAIYSCYTDPDDDLFSDYFGEKTFLAKLPKALRTPERIVTKITGNHNRFRLYGPNDAAIERERPGGKTEAREVAMGEPQAGDKLQRPFLQARHPVYLPKQWQGRIGVLGDLHVSSRQALYKLVNTQVIPGADPADSPLLGKIAHENLSSVSRLMAKLSGQCDMLALVGDLYDHSRNCDPAYFAGSIKKSKDLWAAMDFAQHQDNHDAYPRDIDGLWMLSQILHYYNDHKKPVVYVTGNHEAYETPYGISPRTFGVRANETIPADHNLTIYEACLLYGPEYSATGTKGLKMNFDPKNFDWVYCLFSPWKDCVLSYRQEAMEHNFVCLGWGAKEYFIADALLGPDSLPRASEACTEEQLQLVQWAAKRPRATTWNSILSHFTFASFAAHVPFAGDKQQEVGVNVHTQCETGSFFTSRLELYNCINDGSIRYTISGHSHRAGVYAYAHIPPEKMKKRLDNPGANPKNQGPQGSSTYKIPVTGTVGDGKTVLLNTKGRRYSSLVCGSAGPFGCQNLHGQLAGLGMDLPQGFLLDIQGERLDWVKDDRVKPRLAVIMDYLWYLEDCVPFVDEDGYPFGGLIKDPGSKDAFLFRGNAKFNKVFGNTHPFEQISLIAVGPMGSDPAILRMQATEKQIEVKIAKDLRDHDEQDKRFTAYRLEGDVGGLERLKKGIEQIKSKVTRDSTPIISHFLSITFREIPGFVESKHYDLNSPWCFPVQIQGDYERIFRIGDASGELPDYDWYGERWEDEYSTKD